MPPWENANLYWMEREYLQARCLPVDLVEKSENFLKMIGTTAKIEPQKVELPVTVNNPSDEKLFNLKFDVTKKSPKKSLLKYLN